MGILAAALDIKNVNGAAGLRVSKQERGRRRGWRVKVVPTNGVLPLWRIVCVGKRNEQLEKSWRR